MTRNSGNATYKFGKANSWHYQDFGFGVSVVLISVLFTAFSIGAAYAQDGGGALDFDGADDRVVIGKNMDPPDQGTVEFWLNPDKAGGARPMGGHDNFECRVEGGATGWTISHQFSHGDLVLYGTIQSPLGEWHHVACTWDLSTEIAQIYIDGVFDIADEQADDNPGSFTFTIGTRTGTTDYLDGRLDEVRIWSEVRTEEQIQEYMNKSIANPENEPELFAYWRFDEEEGTDCIDHSGNGFDGTMTNMDPAARIVSTVEISGAAILPAGKLSTTWGSIRNR